MAGSGDPGQAVTPNVTLDNVVFSNDAAKGGAGGRGAPASAAAAAWAAARRLPPRRRRRHWDGRCGRTQTGSGQPGIVPGAAGGGSWRPAAGGGLGRRRRRRRPAAAAAAASAAAVTARMRRHRRLWRRRRRRRLAAAPAASAAAAAAPPWRRRRRLAAASAAAAAAARRLGGGGGFGGGNATDSGGGGGLGAGGDIFVQQGATLTIEGGSLSGGSVAGGAAADEAETATPSAPAFSCKAIRPSRSGRRRLRRRSLPTVITDQDGNPTAENFTAGSGGVVIDAAAGGTVEFTGANTYTGGTLVEAGRLLLASGGAAGTGGITVQSGAHVVAGSGGSASDITLDSGGRLNVLAGGTVSGLTIDDPDDRSFTARATVASGGTLEGTTNLMGGELLLHQSAVVPTGMDLILQSTARLLLDETGHGFEGVIRDFGPSDTLDLAHVAFAGGGRNATTVHWDRTGGDRGTLTVAHGSQAIDLHLAGHYTTSDFAHQERRRTRHNGAFCLRGFAGGTSARSPFRNLVGRKTMPQTLARPTYKRCA